MERYFLLLCTTLFLLGCRHEKAFLKLKPEPAENHFDFLLAFGSCNKHDKPNRYWDDILAQNPDVWIWGGDNIYADTSDMERLKTLYDKQNEVKEYALLKEKVPIIGTWDDHDYGVNDGGAEFEMKRESQQVFLDFLGVSPTSARRNQEGVYNSHEFELPNGKVKIFVLDTRYFRSGLIKDEDPNKRYKPNADEEATILGAAQWDWFKQELNASDADFNIIVSSIQFLSREHGFETWGNFPLEVEKMEQVIIDSGAKGVFFLSGDRHLSEFSRAKLRGLPYPLIEFTSSGLTHAYTSFDGEPNRFRFGTVVSHTSYGIVGIVFRTGEVCFRMMAENGKIIQEIKQHY